MASSSSSSRDWVYDVFVSFRGEDVRKNFLSHFLKELDRKLITTFIDNKIEKGESIDPVLKQAIRTSRIAVVVFSENYASSSWCLDELVEILKCKEESGQLIIPVFYGLDPSHVRKQNGKFGEVFSEICQKNSENETKLWRESLIEVANLCGNHPPNWPNDATMVEEMVDHILGKILNLIPRKEFGNFVGMEDHIAEMTELLHLESEEVRMVGIWGTSGIGKTSIARVLYSQLSHRFQCKIFIDKTFVSNVMKKYENANPYDPNVKLHLVGIFLSEILDKKDIKVDSFDAMRQMLKHHKVLIFIDDLDHQEVLDSLVGQTQWFGCGTRIIVITENKHFLRAHGIDHIYEVRLPSHELAFKMFCKSAFGKYSPPDGLMEFASKITLSAGNLPLGLHVLGLYVRGREKEDLIKLLPDVLKSLNGDIEKTLRVSYDGLNSENHKAIFRHIAYLFNGESVSNIKLLLSYRNLDVNTGLTNLVDKALIHIRYGSIEMHSLLQKLGKEIVHAQSNEPGEREFLDDAKDICALLENNTGTSKILGIALEMDEMNELHINESAFKKMHNLIFLKIYTKRYKRKGVRWNLPEGFDLPQKLRFLRWDKYPNRCIPSSFCPENLVKLIMRNSKLERLWDGVQTLGGLKEIDLDGSKYLKEIPDLSKATNLKELNLRGCSSLVELPFSIKYLNKLEDLWMIGCSSLETLPSGINLKSLDYINLEDCPRLKTFPDISTNISKLYLTQGRINECHSNLSRRNIGMNRITNETVWARLQPYSLRELHLWDIPSLVELPSSIKNFIKLEEVEIYDCINLKTLPTGINFCSLRVLCFNGCSRLRTFPNFSTNIERLNLDETWIEEVPWWIENFTKLKSISMRGCNNLVRVSLHIYKLKLLEYAEFSYCGALTEASWNDHPIAIEEVFSGVEMPSYFTQQTIGDSLTNIPLRFTSLSQYLFKFRACVLVVFNYERDDYVFDDSDDFDYYEYYLRNMVIDVDCQFKDRLGNSFHWVSENKVFLCFRRDSVLFVLDYLIPPDECNAPLAQVNYDHVDMEIHVRPIYNEDGEDSENDTRFKIKRWGIQLLEECSSPMNGLSNPYNGPHVCEDSEEYVQRVGKRHRETESLDFWERPFKKMFSCVKRFFRKKKIHEREEA